MLPAKTVRLSVRVPPRLAADIAREARNRKVSKSDVMRERIESAGKLRQTSPLADIADLIGSVDCGPPDLSARKKHY